MADKEARIPECVARLVEISECLSPQQQAEVWRGIALNLGEKLNEKTNRGTFSTDCADSEDPRGRLRK